MKIGELAFKIHVHRIHAWRLATAGVIPATKRTKGGHFYFVKCRSLTRWINFMQSGGAFRKKELSRAYKKGYGNPKLAKKRDAWKTAKEHLDKFKHYQKQMADDRREYKDYENSWDDLFYDFFYNTDDLIRVLDELTVWHDCEVKWRMAKASSKRLTILRDLINNWLNQQQSSRT
jgi:hypothetical protein